MTSNVNENRAADQTPKIPQLQKVPMTDKQLKQNEVKLWTVTFDSFLEKQSR